MKGQDGRSDGLKRYRKRCVCVENVSRGIGDKGSQTRKLLGERRRERRLWRLLYVGIVCYRYFYTTVHNVRQRIVIIFLRPIYSHFYFIFLPVVHDSVRKPVWPDVVGSDRPAVVAR